jgi:exopolysaccharide biosynthesis polyprenyl glycosylphosphotransferase
MQSDIEYDTPLVSTQGQYETEQKVLPVARDHSLQETVSGDRYKDFPNTGEITLAQELNFRKVHGRRKSSPIVWHLLVKIGDSVVLVALLVWLTKPALHLSLSLPGSIFGAWTANYLWICLAFASWTFAVNVMQAQELSCAASLLKGPLYALCSLVFMLIFPALLLYFLIGGQVISYVRPLLIFLVMVAPILISWRVLIAEIINLPRFRRQAVIVGVNAAGKDMARELLRARHPGISVLGYIGEHADGRRQMDGLPILGGASALRLLVQNGMIDMIIMAIDFKANVELFQEALEGAQQGISLVPVAAAYESASGKIPLEHIGDQWYIALPAKQFLTPLYLCWRKVVDLAFGICGLAVLGVLLPIVALLIYLDSPGPIFYSQERAGYRGRTFRILKFRSMHSDAERTGDGVWVSKGDARVTRIGRLLRAMHLDELPQVLNIVRGEMNLIGPRPERPDYVTELAKQNHFYNYRLSVKPGLTGWAQVKYGYGISEQDELVKLQYDLYYIKHQSFLLDVCILLKTIVEVVLCHGI